MRYVIKEEWDDVEQRCPKEGCGFLNGVYEEPRRNCPLCGTPLGAFPAYGTEAQRSKQLTGMDRTLREYK